MINDIFRNNYLISNITELLLKHSWVGGSILSCEFIERIIWWAPRDALFGHRIFEISLKTMKKGKRNN